MDVVYFLHFICEESIELVVAVYLLYLLWEATSIYLGHFQYPLGKCRKYTAEPN